MKKLALSLMTLFLVGGSLSLHAQEIEKQLVIEERKNDAKKEESPYVILVSLDGFRYDYIEKHNAKFLAEFASLGTKAESLIPSYPSVTFPNHYSIVTGMYPGHHGLVGNTMYDRNTEERYSLGNAKAVTDAKWYGGTPLWVLAEQQGMLSACYYWPGSEAPIQKVLPTYYYKYSEKSDIDSRLVQVKNWLTLPAEKRPHFITFYMPEVDHAGHQFGPDAEETTKAVQYVDEAMEKLYTLVKDSGLPINLVIVSDHGMLELDQKTLLKLPFEVDEKEMAVASNGTYVSLFIKDSKKIKTWYDKIKKSIDPKLMEVHLKDNLPQEYHFGSKDDRYNRVGDIVLTAHAPYYFTNRPLAGSHGFDPAKVKEMHALFMAVGPNIKEKNTVKSFENVHIYPMIAQILGLTIDEKQVDGTRAVAKEVLK
ncbi:putative AlkP superfamily pyrophosphatase or phosphodiesterase [Myroides gitamensis]|uniref:alkaline phosphatase family protein n=1 Tax=Myroides odoratus TaxID=256 RepID=UPI002166D065|nr:ectonucleotide pyrophosphatase/phosphodiesterase [Myroides odoratus]MCS4237104.1 putative AlkP superfamily pyrophosphatase or phosphodiesterase [Myroides odoratus]MDH6602176.1 putative AlkP superfamily pyrophosphatase or phosphodiesterase [Myroides gitamensis]